MHIVVCLKQVLDPEVPARAFGIAPDGRTPVAVGVAAAQVLDSYAENALELGLQLRNMVPGSKLTALCVGDAAHDEAIRRAFALTADAGVRVWDSSWHELDALAASQVCGRAITSLGGADVVLCGRQAADVEESVFGPALAEELGMPCVTAVSRAERSNGTLTAEREAEGSTVTVEVSLPSVLTISSAPGNVPRMAKVKDVMMAKRKTIAVLGGAELGLAAGEVMAGYHIERLSIPHNDTECEMLLDGDVDENAARLVVRLRALGLL